MCPDPPICIGHHFYRAGAGGIREGKVIEARITAIKLKDEGGAPKQDCLVADATGSVLTCALELDKTRFRFVCQLCCSLFRPVYIAFCDFVLELNRCGTSSNQFFVWFSYFVPLSLSPFKGGWGIRRSSSHAN